MKTLKRRMPDKEINRWYQEKNFSQLEKALEIKFLNRSLLINSFVHRSFLNENKDFFSNHNERLEFLGDSVLGFLVTERLYQSYPHSEGELTRWRSALVNTKTLAALAEDLCFQDYLFLSRGERENSVSESVLAGTFESLIGAVYLDQGLEAVNEIIRKRLMILLPEIIASSSYIDPKSRLQEIVQSMGKPSPKYQVLSESGPDHAKHFEINVSVSGKEWGRGTGRSKQAAEQTAAEEALNLLKKKR